MGTDRTHSSGSVGSHVILRTDGFSVAKMSLGGVLLGDISNITANDVRYGDWRTFGTTCPS